MTMGADLEIGRSGAPAGAGHPPSASPMTVIAFGGNALLQPGDHGTQTEQLRRAREAAGWLADVAEQGHRLLLVHGNGPQVGQVMIQMEEAANKVPPGSLDVAVAQTEGSMGYLLELALRNRLRDSRPHREIASLLSLVVVDGADPGFSNPTKPVGPFFSSYRAKILIEEHGWRMIEDAGRGWRKVVSSPRPLEVVGLAAVQALLTAGHFVIAGGGGGIPVVRGVDGSLRGGEAVIDKDYTASLFARQLGADTLIILTGIAQVVENFGKPDARPLPCLPLRRARELLAAGQFPPGSMGPKIRAAIDFVEATGQKVLITDVDHLREAVEGRSGTAIVPDGAAVEEIS